MCNLEIKAFITDLDGTLTDGGYSVDCNGCVQKKYNTRDFYFMSLLLDRGIDVFVVTSSNDDCDLFRMNKVGIELFQGIGNKKDFLEEVLFVERDLSWQDVLYVGDYLNDLECVKSAGMAACPSDSHNMIKNVNGNIILSRRGGDACVAEVIDWYLGIFDQ
jgi:N-acylneuraminate cytidylyltransferase